MQYPNFFGLGGTNGGGHSKQPQKPVMAAFLATFRSIKRNDFKVRVFPHHRASLRRRFRHERHVISRQHRVQPWLMPNHIPNPHHGLDDKKAFSGGGGQRIILFKQKRRYGLGLCYHPKRIRAMPETTATHASILAKVNFSFRKTTPKIRAIKTEVSRKDETIATGRVKHAHSTIT